MKRNFEDPELKVTKFDYERIMDEGDGDDDGGFEWGGSIGDNGDGFDD